MRYTIPTQAEVQGQAVVYAPVVLDVSSPRYVVILSVVLQRSFIVALGITEQEVSEAVSCVTAIEAEVALRVDEDVLDLLVQCPASTKLELMSTLGPGN